APSSGRSTPRPVQERRTKRPSGPPPPRRITAPKPNEPGSNASATRPRTSSGMARNPGSSSRPARAASPTVSETFKPDHPLVLLALDRSVDYGRRGASPNRIVLGQRSLLLTQQREPECLSGPDRSDHTARSGGQEQGHELSGQLVQPIRARL